MSIYQLLRYSVDFLIGGTCNVYTLITIQELKPLVFLAFKSALSWWLQGVCGWAERVHPVWSGGGRRHVWGGDPTPGHSDTRSVPKHFYILKCMNMVFHSGLPLVREKSGKFKVREKSGNFRICQGNLEFCWKSGKFKKSQGNLWKFIFHNRLIN